MSFLRHPLALMLLAFLGGCAGDVVVTDYSQRSEAADAIARGWIPAALPASATGIRESHYTIGDVRHGTFGFDGRDSASFLSALTPTTVGNPVRASLRENMESLGYVYYSYENFEIAVDWKNRRGDFWLGPR